MTDTIQTVKLLISIMLTPIDIIFMQLNFMRRYRSQNRNFTLNHSNFRPGSSMNRHKGAFYKRLEIYFRRNCRGPDNYFIRSIRCYAGPVLPTGRDYD